MTNKIKISVIKNSALKLRGTYQLPSYLVYLILHIDNDTPITIIEYLKQQSVHMLRLKGYYKKYPSIEASYNDELKKYMQSVLERN